jgi:hypothetical protein
VGAEFENNIRPGAVWNGLIWVNDYDLPEAIMQVTGCSRCSGRSMIRFSNLSLLFIGACEFLGESA